MATLAHLLPWGAKFVAGPGLGSRARRLPIFSFGGRSYAYLDRRHGWTWLNERCVEVPLVAAAIRDAGGTEILEVGNVLRHYLPASHRVIDKYEASDGVENVDVFDFASERGFDLVVSVSTLEHVGWDEPARDPDLALGAVDHLKSLVRPGGRLLITVPVGYHPRLDKAMLSGEVPLDFLGALACNYRTGDWVECDPVSVEHQSYDRLLYRASAVLIGEWNAPF